MAFCGGVRGTRDRFAGGAWVLSCVSAGCLEVLVGSTLGPLGLWCVFCWKPGGPGGVLLGVLGSWWVFYW